MKKFALIGSAGYIAERHMKAIKENGGNLVACLDKVDRMGHIDKYFPEAEMYFDEGRFFDSLFNPVSPENKVDYIVICSPNHTHQYFIITAINKGFDVICEKPITTNTYDINQIDSYNKRRQKNIYSILQLRIHPEILKIKEKYKDKKADIKLIYNTPRGKWYHQSWKGKVDKSGGLAMNIGVHFFDMLIWIFGSVLDIEIIGYSYDYISGILKLERANIEWSLSISMKNKTKRELIINGETIDFTNGFTNLHTKYYSMILSGDAYKIDDAVESIKLCEQIKYLING